MEKINGVAVYRQGNPTGKPVVFIHAFPLTHAMWDGQIEFLSKAYSTVSYDVRGHGDSEVGDGQYTLELFVDDLFAILDCLNVKDAVLCGLSMGGYIALRAVEREPKRFSGLVLCDTKSASDGNEAKIKRALSLRAIKEKGIESFADGFIPQVLSPKTLQTKPQIAKSARELLLKNSVTGVCGALLALAARTDTTEALAKMNLPTLILVGQEDKVTPLAAAESMSKALPRATLQVIPEAAHLANLENPKARVLMVWSWCRSTDCR